MKYIAFSEAYESMYVDKVEAGSAVEAAEAAAAKNLDARDYWVVPAEWAVLVHVSSSVTYAGKVR